MVEMKEEVNNNYKKKRHTRHGNDNGNDNDSGNIICTRKMI